MCVFVEVGCGMVWRGVARCTHVGCGQSDAVHSNLSVCMISLAVIFLPHLHTHLVTSHSVSPHELIQEVTVASKRRFVIGKQAECIDFLSWLLNELHRGVGGTRKPGSSVVHKAFQGACPS